MINLMGGEVRVTSELGEGSRFVILVPTVAPRETARLVSKVA